MTIGVEKLAELERKDGEIVPKGCPVSNCILYI